LTTGVAGGAVSSSGCLVKRSAVKAPPPREMEHLSSPP